MPPEVFKIRTLANGAVFFHSLAQAAALALGGIRLISVKSGQK